MKLVCAKGNRSIAHSFLFFCLFACALVFSPLIHAQEVTPLLADQAFKLTVDKEHNALKVNLAIEPGYFVYRERLAVNVQPQSLVKEISYPQGEFKEDLNRGRVEVFRNHLMVPVHLNSAPDNMRIEVNYQGCSDGGFCYPPTQKTFNIGNVSGLEAKSAISSLLTNQNVVQNIFQSQSMTVTLLIFAGLGLLLAFTPCVLPMVPILTGIIIGQKGRIGTKQAFILSSVYVLGSSITYACAGVGAAMMGSSLQAMFQKPLYIVSVSLLFVILAGSLFGLYHLQTPRVLHHHLHNISTKQESGSYWGVFLMGIISTLIVSPCVTAPLVGVLIYIGQTGDTVLGAAALFSMGLGMGLPLILIGISAGKWLPKTGPWMIAIKEMFGMLMLGMAIWLLARILPVSVTNVLWAGLTAGAVIYIVLGLTRSYRLHTRWAYTLGVAAGLMSIILIAGNMKESMMVANNAKFITVRSTQELTKELSYAQSIGKPAIVDFYADWCESCVVMDQKVFDKQTVQDALKNYILIRADLSANDIENEKLMRQYSVPAPPMVLFFDNSGKEKNMHRIIGEVNSNEFLNRLNTFEMVNCHKDKINC